MYTTGKLIKWDDEKGFGFIMPIAGGKQVFIHISAFTRHSCRPKIKQIITYTLSSDKKGRPRAENATLDGYKSQKNSNRQQIKEKQYKEILAIITSGVFLIIVGLSVLSGEISPLILGLYIITSLFTFIMYAHDKTAARENSWRVREKILQLLSLMGGWPGALIAQQKLHHKSRKLSFQIVFWLTIILNCCAFIYLFTPNKTTKLRMFIEQINKIDGVLKTEVSIRLQLLRNRNDWEK